MAFPNLRFALRLIRRNPALSVCAILAAGLGIGATSAIFSVTDAVLLRPLPLPHSERLVNLWETMPKRNQLRFPVAAANYYDWRAQARSFSAIGAYSDASFGLETDSAEPERYTGVACDPGFFRTLGVAPTLGRIFTDDEDQPGHNRVVLLSYSLWQNRFGADPHILGRILNINSIPRSVIGIMPPGFDYPSPSSMWAPMALDPAARARRDIHTVRVVARLKDGVTVAGAGSEMQTIAAQLAQRYPDLDGGEGSVAHGLLDDLTGQLRPTLVLLLSGAAFVLLIACANVANLLLACASGRQREIALRVSLGASRGAVLRQMLTESLLLACAAGIVGLLIAKAAFSALLAAAPASVPRLQEIGLDARTVAITFAITLFTGVLLGLAPAFYALRVDAHTLLKEGIRGTTRRRGLRTFLVAGQVAAAAVLLTGAGLLARTLLELERIDPGFDPNHVMTMRLAPGLKYRGHPDLQIQFARDILHNVSALPGVRTAAVSTDVPLLGNPLYIMRYDGMAPVTPAQAPTANFFAVTPGFFATMGMRIVRGRAIAETDAGDSPLVAVVNQTFADKILPGQDPIGKRIEIGFSTPPRWRQVVGVVADVKIAGLDQDTPVQVYTAYLQSPGLGLAPAISILARTASDPEPLGQPMKNAILQADRTQPVFALQPMTEVVAKSLERRSIAFYLLLFFAISSLTLAAIGIYGVISYSVTERTAEIGIRIALGARGSQVLLQVTRQGMLPVFAGLAVGLGGALLLARMMDALLFHVDPNDPLVLLVASLAIAIPALIACYFPARRASHVDPVVALRSE